MLSKLKTVNVFSETCSIFQNCYIVKKMLTVKFIANDFTYLKPLHFFLTDFFDRFCQKKVFYFVII